MNCLSQVRPRKADGTTVIDIVESAKLISYLQPSQGVDSGRCDWLHFAARAGEEGRAWAEQYRRYVSIVELSNTALELLRDRQLELGRATLQEYLIAVEGLEGIAPSMRAVLNRWYQGVAAFYLYCIEDFNGADKAMLLAHEAVVEAISESGFLIVLSVHCQEFCLHHARISRNRQRWQEMHSYIERARAMVMDSAPLCDMKGGQSIYFSTLCRFFESLQPLDAREQAATRGLVDKEERTRSFDKFVRRLVRLPDFAISYP
jgi:hypothetical protein